MSMEERYRPYASNEGRRPIQKGRGYQPAYLSMDRRIDALEGELEHLLRAIESMVQKSR